MREKRYLVSVGVFLGLKGVLQRASLYIYTAGRVLSTWTLGTLYLLVLLPGQRPGTSACAAYLRTVIRSGFLAERAWAASPGRDKTAPGDHPLLPRSRNFSPAEPPAILKDHRVKGLQEKVAVEVFRRLFGVVPGRRDRKILSCFSSVSWLCANMAMAAGRAMGTEEQHSRNRVVFPVFMGAMEMHLGWLEKSKGLSIRDPGRRGRRVRRFTGVGRHGEITGCLYPEVVSFKKYYLEAKLRGDLISSRRLLVRTAAYSGLCACEVAAIQLAAGNGPGALQTLKRLKAIQNFF